MGRDDMTKSSNIPFNDSLTMNQLVYGDFLNRLKSLAITNFEWTGLPNGIPGKFIEETLYYEGKIAFFEDANLGLMVAKVAPAGTLNIYNEPIKLQLYATNYNAQIDADKAVIIHNNYLSKPTYETIRLFAYRLYEVERSIDTNIKGQKFPIIIRGPKEQMLTMQNLYMKYDGNQPFIFADKSLDLDAIKVLNTNSPYVADKLTLYKHEVWNECLTFLGIANANTDKRERLIVDEANANDQLIELGADVMLAARQDDVKQINAMFDTDITVTQRKPDNTEPEGDTATLGGE